MFAVRFSCDSELCIYRKFQYSEQKMERNNHLPEYYTAKNYNPEGT